jgi:hypothetical protein
VNGGSGYFDGTGDYLSVPDDASLDFGTGDFTIECWFYITANAAADPGNERNAALVATLGGPPANGFAFFVDGNSTTTGTGIRLRTYVNDVAYNLTFTGTINQSQWNYAVVSRVGTTTKIFLNGAEVASGTLANQTVNTTTNLKIGSLAFGTFPWAFPGYIASVRVRKGVGATSFSVPTAPFTAISDTSLLCNFTNAGIFDNTGKNNLETVGNAQIDTTTKKYGTGSMEFDGTGDYLLLPSNVNLILQPVFTVEGWFYFNSLSTVSGLWFAGTISSDSNRIQCAAQTTGGINFFSVGTGADILTCNTSSGVVTTGQWYHIACVFTGGVGKVYVDGVEKASATATTTLPSPTTFYVGTARAASAQNYLNGFIDDLRITKGVARYTAAFTPPTAAFPNE